MALSRHGPLTSDERDALLAEILADAEAGISVPMAARGHGITLGAFYKMLREQARERDPPEPEPTHAPKPRKPKPARQPGVRPMRHVIVSIRATPHLSIESYGIPTNRQMKFAIEKMYFIDAMANSLQGEAMAHLKKLWGMRSSKVIRRCLYLAYGALKREMLPKSLPPKPHPPKPTLSPKQAVLAKYPEAFLAQIEVDGFGRPQIAYYLVAIPTKRFGPPESNPIRAWQSAERAGITLTTKGVSNLLAWRKFRERRDRGQAE